MPDPAAAQIATQLADLRLQVSALQVVAKTSSLPEMLRQTRRTIAWSAVVIAIALIVSSVLRIYNDKHVYDLERRVEVLERATNR